MGSQAAKIASALRISVKWPKKKGVQALEESQVGYLVGQQVGGEAAAAVSLHVEPISEDRVLLAGGEVACTPLVQAGAMSAPWLGSRACLGRCAALCL